MDTGYYKFYEKKSGLLFILLACLVFGTVSFLTLAIEHTTLTSSVEDRLGFIILFGFCVCIFSTYIKRLFTRRPYIEITPTYIKVSNFEKLLWTDIIAVKNFGAKNAYLFWYFDIKTTEYKLTFFQNICQLFNWTPFYISLLSLSKKDREELKHILKEHVPQNDLD